MNVLILGGSGHVSGALARAALAGGHEVWTVTRGQRTLPDGVRAIKADRHDHAATARAIADAAGPWDLVVDCICFDLPDIRQDIELFRDRATQFVMVSTDFVYDPTKRRNPQPEDDADYVASGEGALGYGAKKRACELQLTNGDTGGMAWTIIRPCHIYGPTSQLGCLPLHGRDPQLIARLRAGETLQLVAAGRLLQQPITAADLARTILSVAGNDRAHGRVFNAAGPDVIASVRYYQIIAEALGVGLRVSEVDAASYLREHPAMAPFICDRVYDLTRLRDAGLHVPATPIDVGLREQVAALDARPA